MDYTTNSLEVNGRLIPIVKAGDQWWIAVKPVCEALGVNYNHAFQNLSEDEILAQLFAKQQTTGADGKTYEMVCLPERYIYGWLFSLRSESPVLLEYKKICYDALYNYFHGIVMQRVTLLSERNVEEAEIKQLEKALEAKQKTLPEYVRLNELKAKSKQRETALKQIDQKMAQQLSLFSNTQTEQQ